MSLLAKAALTSTNYTRKKSDETHAALNVIYRTLFIQKMYDSSELSFTDVPNIEKGYSVDFLIRQGVFCVHYKGRQLSEHVR